MRKFNPSFSSFVLLSALAASLITTNVHAATHHHSAESAYQEFRPFSSNGPKFAGFFGNLGLAYNMASGVSYTDTFVAPPAVPSSTPDASGKTSGSNFVSGLLKLGYAFRMGQTGYLGVAGFYNLSATQNLMNVSYQYSNVSSNPLQISNKTTQSAGYGLLLKPGMLLDAYSLLYGNVGLQMTTLKFSSQTNLPGGAAAGNSMSTSKSATTYILGVGYERQMSFIKSARNLTWFTELNYGLGSKINVSQSMLPASGDPLSAGRIETYSATPGGLQLVLGVGYYF